MAGWGDLSWLTIVPPRFWNIVLSLCRLGKRLKLFLAVCVGADEPMPRRSSGLQHRAHGARFCTIHTPPAVVLVGMMRRVRATLHSGESVDVSVQSSPMLRASLPAV
jgi:hypothetical protein